MLSFRKATAADMMLYFEWANDDLVRENAINSSKILLKDHVKWFHKKISSQDSIMLLGLKGDKPVGQLRIDLDEKNNEGIIDYSIDKAFRGQGLGTIILKEGCNYFFKLGMNIPLVGLVKEKNNASIAAFIKAGYSQGPKPVTINDEKYLKFSANA
jgi:RimJ/RimL family protein N-acetyltransferase